MQIKRYQEEAVNELTGLGKKMLTRIGDKTIVFKSPTGSGKTLMIAEFLRRLADDSSVSEFACIWTAPRKLHEQSRDKLEKYYEDSRALDCVFFDELNDNQIGMHEILFLNWESIRQEGNIIIRENERDFNLRSVLDKTRKAERNIILIIDESHYHLSEISRELVRNIAPKILVEVSATPVLNNPDRIVPVDIEDVKAEGMIKKSVILNDGVKNKLLGNGVKPGYAGRADDFILEQALAKRAELAAAFRRAGANVNPLLCIQLPDRRTEQDDNIKNNALRTLARAGITEENRKLAIYLSGEKENLENIARNDNAAEAMIFKQAIALGWDCPRAHILVLFRNWRNLTFSVQTLGRIMRMPEPETGHYADEILNSGYVYTNLPEIAVYEDVAGGYVIMHTARRADDYAPIKLPSVHRLRQRELTRLSSRFIKFFLQAADAYGLKGKINMRDRQVDTCFISDYESEGADAIAGEQIRGNVRADVNNEDDLQKLFDYFVRDNLSPYYPEDRSIGRVRTAIYEFFRDSLEMPYLRHFAAIVKIILSAENHSHFVNTLNTAKDAYKAETEQREEELKNTPEWEVPESADYSEIYTEFAAQKSVMRPFYVLKNGWKTETAFVKILEESPNVRWWFKNGEDESKYFAVPYKENGEEKPFYVDFIVQFTDDKIGLYDTKSGITVNIAGDKSDGLLSYIKTQNAVGKNLRGGIVAPVNPNNYGQGWKLYTGKGANIRNSDSAEWKPLEL